MKKESDEMDERSRKTRLIKVYIPFTIMQRDQLFSEVIL